MGSDGDLRPLFRKHLPAVFWTSLESGGTAGGIPDAVGVYRSCTFFVEFKVASGWRPRIRPLQAGFLTRLHREGGRGFVATRRRKLEQGNTTITDQLWIHNGADAAALRDGGLRAVPPLLRMDGGPRVWDWKAVITTLSDSV